eukprot:CAMPEP_0168615000 /NCGR_PEP_ID=MMETSP0449_2-20121227/4273_1 /TAXON_ID=1082188 /ORGANISM="Strombidium rassoulzadegani, Strain ras09" /LENGTH=169 /DNA_ID=CAMNT_0008655715 /DNA_START=297 /DNA_END=806 /DNA_ORIENTATION=+
MVGSHSLWVLLSPSGGFAVDIESLELADDAGVAGQALAHTHFYLIPQVLVLPEEVPRVDLDPIDGVLQVGNRRRVGMELQARVAVEVPASAHFKFGGVFEVLEIFKVSARILLLSGCLEEVSLLGRGELAVGGEGGGTVEDAVGCRGGVSLVGVGDDVDSVAGGHGFNH